MARIIKLGKVNNGKGRKIFTLDMSTLYKEANYDTPIVVGSSYPTNMNDYKPLSYTASKELMAIAYMLVYYVNGINTGSSEARVYMQGYYNLSGSEYSGGPEISFAAPAGQHFQSSVGMTFVSPFDFSQIAFTFGYRAKANIPDVVQLLGGLMVIWPSHWYPKQFSPYVPQSQYNNKDRFRILTDLEIKINSQNFASAYGIPVTNRISYNGHRMFSNVNPTNCDSLDVQLGQGPLTYKIPAWAFDTTSDHTDVFPKMPSTLPTGLIATVDLVTDSSVEVNDARITSSRQLNILNVTALESLKYRLGPYFEWAKIGWDN